MKGQINQKNISNPKHKQIISPKEFYAKKLGLEKNYKLLFLHKRKVEQFLEKKGYKIKYSQLNPYEKRALKKGEVLEGEFGGEKKLLYLHNHPAIDIPSYYFSSFSISGMGEEMKALPLHQTINRLKIPPANEYPSYVEFGSFIHNSIIRDSIILWGEDSPANINNSIVISLSSRGPVIDGEAVFPKRFKGEEILFQGMGNYAKSGPIPVKKE